MKVGSRKGPHWEKEHRYSEHPPPMSVFGVLTKDPWSLGLAGYHYLGFNLVLLEDGLAR